MSAGRWEGDNRSLWPALSGTHQGRSTIRPVSNDREHHHHGPGGKRTSADYARDFLRNWNDHEGSLAEKVRLTILNRTRAYLIPPIKGCCGRGGEPGC